jgi:alpha-tubulin suppressor-like RCC1 family protein
MRGRSFTSTGRLCIVAALLMPAAAIAGQLNATATSAAPATTTVAFAWGDNSLGELGDGVSGGISDTPVAVSLPAGVTPTAMAGGGGAGDPQPLDYAGYAIGSDGKLYSWGDDSVGELGNGTSGGSSDTPVVVSLPAGVTPTVITASQGTGYAIGSNGKLYAWGDNSYDTLGNGTSGGSSDTPVVVSLPAGVTPTAIAGGYLSAYALGSNGKLYAWGDDYYGELGNGMSGDGAGGTALMSDTPVVVSLPAGVTPVTIAGGGGCAYAISSNGTLYAWGFNTYGQLGDGTTTNNSTPEVIALAPGVTAKAITGGGGFAHAIGSDGKLYGWGVGSSGQLGVGSGSLSPVVVTLAPGVTPKAIDDNLHTGYALGSDGNIYAWGYGLQGEFGNGTTGNGSPPVVVSLPAGSTVKHLTPEPGSSSGFAIVNVPDAAPAITTSPSNKSVLATQGATFTAAASGFPAPTVLWQVSTGGGPYTPVSGATSDTLTITATTLSESGNQYEAVFSNGAGTATTNPATLTVTAPPAPTTSVALPTNDATIVSATWLAASAQSPIGIKSVIFEVSGGSISDQVISPSFLTMFGWIGGWDSSDVPNGTYRLQSVATDNAGTSTTSAAVAVTVDNPPLNTEVLIPSTGATLSGSAAILDASATGTSPITGVQFEVTGGALTDHIVGSALLTLYGWILEWNTTTVTNGPYLLQSVATETGGTAATSTGINITVDN